jgi:hypothetical protein
MARVTITVEVDENEATFERVAGIRVPAPTDRSSSFHWDSASEAFQKAVSDAADWIAKNTPKRPVRDNPQA